MIQDNKLTLTDILSRFDMEKKAEDAYGMPDVNPEELQAAMAAAQAQAQGMGGMPQGMGMGMPMQQPAMNPACPGGVCPPGNGSAPDAGDLQNAASRVSQADGEAVQAAKALRDMADDYIDSHNSALKKEAALFGEMFADSFYDKVAQRAYMDNVMSKTAEYAGSSPVDVYDDSYRYTMSKIAEAVGSDDEYFDYGYMDKTAEQALTEAYREAMMKIAAEEAYAEAANQMAGVQPQMDPAAMAQIQAAMQQQQQPGQGLNPEAMAQLQAAEQGQAPTATVEEGEGELSPEAVAAAVIESARAARESAAAAGDLVDNLNEADGVNGSDAPETLPELTDQAYQEAMGSIMGNQAVNASQNAYDQAMGELVRQ